MRVSRDGWILAALIALAGCASAPGGESGNDVDIVGDLFAEAQAEVRAEILGLAEIGRNRDWDRLRSVHLDSPKFSEIVFGFERNGFEEMLAGEIERVSATENFSIDWRDLEIAVFGDVAIATAFPVFAWEDASGEPVELAMRATMAYAKTANGWKIAHEHLSSPCEE